MNWRWRELRHCRRMFGVVLILVSGGLIGSGASAGQRAEPVHIGVLTESWGPTPAVVGLRDGLVALGYRENEDFMIGVRFTRGDPAELPAAARQLVARGADILVTAGSAANAAKAVQRRKPRLGRDKSWPTGTYLGYVLVSTPRTRQLPHPYHVDTAES